MTPVVTRLDATEGGPLVFLRLRVGGPVVATLTPEQAESLAEALRLAAKDAR